MIWKGIAYKKCKLINSNMFYEIPVLVELITGVNIIIIFKAKVKQLLKDIFDTLMAKHLVEMC